MPEAKAVKQKDWITPVAVVGGGALLAVGAFLVLKKPTGISPGGTFEAKFIVNYGEAGGTYIFQVALGSIRMAEWFDHAEGLQWIQEVQLTEPTEGFELTIECDIPEATPERTYDAEALIRRPDMGQYDYLVKHVTRGAINVRS